MHDYLRAVGFSNIKTRKEMRQLLDAVVDHPDKQFITDNGRSLPLGEMYKSFIKHAGIMVRGEFDENGTFNEDYYFPYYEGQNLSFVEDITVEKQADREEYAGICEVVNLGVSMIFHINNMVDYVKQQMAERTVRHVHAPVSLSALSIDGMVIMPIARSQEQQRRHRMDMNARNNMLAAARKGDQDAIENLTIEDMDMYTTISRRIKREDVLTVVESYFMPYGIACDQYSVMGDIIEVSECTNAVTGEELYQLVVECNDILFDLCINKTDLYGEPAEGRRFRGTVWLQGVVDFEEED